MGALAWVEVLDQRGQVQARHRIDTAPALIGRGYGCDVLLDDPWISPIHLRLFRELDGSLAIEDARSDNGSFDPSGAAITTLPLARGVTLRVGRTRVRVVPGDAPVGATLALHADAPVASHWERGWVGAALALAAGVGFAWDELQNQTDALRAGSVVGVALLFIAGLALWAGIWALIGRAVTHRARFIAHLGIASAAALALLAAFAAQGYAAFLAPASPALEGLVASLALLVIAAMLFGHLSRASTLVRRRALAISITVTFGLAAVMGIVAEDTSRDAASDTPQFSGELKPLAASLIPTQDTTRYFAGLDSLRATVDSLTSDSL